MVRTRVPNVFGSGDFVVLANRPVRMTIDLDLTEQANETARDHLFETLTEALPGDEIVVMADTDLDPHLIRFQLDTGHRLEWAYAHPDAEPRQLTVTVGEPFESTAVPEIDVRDLKPHRRHDVLTTIFGDLGPAEAVVLINDHDPKPLYYELRSMYGDVIEWEYVTQEAGEWIIAIEKTSATSGHDGTVATTFDVRDIPKPERHATIQHRYGMLPTGETMEIIAPHEPISLRNEFEERYGETFSWEVRETEPDRCRVHITKNDQSTSGDEVTIIDELDVRQYPPAERHARIFDSYADLATGEGFILINDHDPKPLYHQFTAEAGPEFRWDYRRTDPGDWRVMIGKSANVSPDRADTEAPL